jgi:hypothetical protein
MVIHGYDGMVRYSVLSLISYLNTVPDRNAGMEPVAHLPIIFPDNQRHRPTRELCNIGYLKNSMKNYLKSELISPFSISPQAQQGFQIFLYDLLLEETMIQGLHGIAKRYL